MSDRINKSVAIAGAIVGTVVAIEGIYDRWCARRRAKENQAHDQRIKDLQDRLDKLEKAKGS